MVVVAEEQHKVSASKSDTLNLEHNLYGQTSIFLIGFVSIQK